MPVRKYNDIEEIIVKMEGASGVIKKVPIGAAEGWRGHIMRVFKIAPGGFTPDHKHDWEHVNYVMSGRGRLTIDGQVHELSERDFAFVPPNMQHQYENPYDDDFEFICIIPNRGEN